MVVIDLIKVFPSLYHSGSWSQILF